MRATRSSPTAACGMHNSKLISKSPMRVRLVHIAYCSCQNRQVGLICNRGARTVPVQYAYGLQQHILTHMKCITSEFIIHTLNYTNVSDLYPRITIISAYMYIPAPKPAPHCQCPTNTPTNRAHVTFTAPTEKGIPG